MSNSQLDSDIRKSQTLFQQGKIAKAKSLLLGVIKKHGFHVEALRLLGYIAGEAGDYRAALKYLSQATNGDPLAADCWYYQGMALQRLGEHEKAIRCFDETLKLHSASFEAMHDAGLSLLALRRFDEAVSRLEKALAVNPYAWQAHYNLGRVMGELRRYEQEIACYDNALELNPDAAQVIANRGIALSELGRYAEAVASFDKALALDPGNAGTLSGRGAALSEMSLFEEADVSFRLALAADPDYPEANWNRALNALLLGDFESGWKGYEWRWQTQRFLLAKRTFSKPLWQGKQTLAGKTILVHAEQGFGDTLQFCRYLDMLAKSGAEVIFEVQPPLKRLLAGIAGASRVVSRGDALPEFDFHCPLMSLPSAFETRMDSIPVPVPYIRPDAELAAQWLAKSNKSDARQVGLVWSGSSTFSNDRNRSVPLSQLLPLLDTGLNFVSLQKEYKAPDLQTLDAHPDIRRFDAELADFADTAALVAAMDLVITVDTAVAHLAGAMGKPVWILLPFKPDFRWLLHRSDSLWYPTARLFRQSEPGDWQGVVAEVTERLLATSREDR